MLSKRNDVVVVSEGAVYRGVRSERAWSWVWVRDVVACDRADQQGLGAAGAATNLSDRTTSYARSGK